MTDDERYENTIYMTEQKKSSHLPAVWFRDAWSAQQKEIDRLRAELTKAFTADKWHGPEEEPEGTGGIICVGCNGMETMTPSEMFGLYDTWNEFKMVIELTAWAYADELPKPEGI